MTIDGRKLDVPVVWHEDWLRHQPAGEVWPGRREDGTEVPERARVILTALRRAGAPIAALSDLQSATE